MGKIVVIFSSPRKDGNSCTIGRAVVDGATGFSTNMFKIYRLNRLRFMNGCTHCDKCKETGTCVIDDDILPILEDIKTADALIVATPMYFGRANAPYYMLESRLYSLIENVRKASVETRRKFIPIITYDADDEVANSLLRSFNDIFAHLRFEIVEGIVYRTDGNKDAARNDKNIRIVANNIGKKLL